MNRFHTVIVDKVFPDKLSWCRNEQSALSDPKDWIPQYSIYENPPSLHKSDVGQAQGRPHEFFKGGQERRKI